MNVSLDTNALLDNPSSPAAREPWLALSRVNMYDVGAVWRRHFEVYIRLWKMQLVAPLIEPIFMLFAFGWGIGSLIAAQVSGVSYLTFVGAGVLMFAPVSRAMFETTYAAYFRMVYQSTFDAILATPVEIESLAFAEVIWATTKSLIDAIIIMLVLFAFGVTDSWFSIFAPLPILLASFLVAAIYLVVTAYVRDIDSYNLYIAIFFSLIFLCGIWFPIDVFPAPLRIAAWTIPLTSAIDLTRSMLTGTFRSVQILQLLYLLVSCFVFTEWSLRAMRRRMVV